jgi:hypothetical protein
VFIQAMAIPGLCKELEVVVRFEPTICGIRSELQGSHFGIS